MDTSYLSVEVDTPSHDSPIPINRVRSVLYALRCIKNNSHKSSRKHFKSLFGYSCNAHETKKGEEFRAV